MPDVCCARCDVYADEDKNDEHFWADFGAVLSMYRAVLLGVSSDGHFYQKTSEKSSFDISCFGGCLKQNFHF